jgi:hypothetical protein
MTHKVTATYNADKIQITGDNINSNLPPMAFLHFMLTDTIKIVAKTKQDIELYICLAKIRRTFYEDFGKEITPIDVMFISTYVMHTKFPKSNVLATYKNIIGKVDELTMSAMELNWTHDRPTYIEVYNIFMDHFDKFNVAKTEQHPRFETIY